MNVRIMMIILGIGWLIKDEVDNVLGLHTKWLRNIKHFKRQNGLYVERKACDALRGGRISYDDSKS